LAFKRVWILAFVCYTALIFAALVILWLRQTSTHVTTQGADALVIRAVLRTDMDAVQTEQLAERIRALVPDIDMEIINDAKGRSLLALQEPWIAEMPDFEVTPLPTLIEMRHPDLLTHPQAVAQFVEKLKKEPGVDFVAYNEMAHDKLVKLATATGAIQRQTVRWLLVALALAGLAAHVGFSRLISAQTLLGLFLRQMTLGITAWVGAVLVFKLWEKGAVATGTWDQLSSWPYFTVGISTLLLMLLGEVLGLLTLRRSK